MGAGLFGSGPDLAPQPSFRPFPLLFRGCILLAAASSTGGGGDVNGRAGKPKTAFTGDSSPVNKGLPRAPQQPAG